MNGQTLIGLRASLPKDPQEISTFDVTVIVCNVTAPQGSNVHSVFAPGSDQGIAMVRLCKELLAHKRLLLVVGGYAPLWGMPDDWDILVKQLLLIARARGVMAIDGTSYYSRMKKCSDGWHFAKEQATINILV